jgi:hypothetical protein
MDNQVTSNNTMGYRNDSPRLRNAIQQNALLIIFTTTAHWAQPMKEWQDPHLLSVTQMKTQPINNNRSFTSL